MTTGDELATEYADTMVGSIADIMARYDGAGHDDECERHDADCSRDESDDTDDADAFCGCDLTCECRERASEELAETYALETVAEVGEPFSVLLTYGGPTAWVEWAGRMGTQSAVLKVSWSSDVIVRRSGAIRELADFYAGYMGAED